MPTSPLAPLLLHLRGAARPPDAGLTDGQLLELFLAGRDEAAFAGLVQRHGPMVLGVCRRVLRDAHDAEDAFQATFLVLARKAASVVPREMVGNWLHGVAYRTALKAKALAARRREKERQVWEMPRPEPPDADALANLRARLDRELQHLPANYRAAVVLCDLEDVPRHEAACRLGLAEGTLSSRLSRGRRLLARRLAGRGQGLSAGAVVVLMSESGAPAAVPTSLLLCTVKAAALVAAGEAAAAVAPAKVAAITEGVLHAMFLDKLKSFLALVLVALVLGASTFVPAVALLGAPADPAEPAEPVALQDETPKPRKREQPKADEKPKKRASDGRARAEEAMEGSFTTKGTARVVVETFNGLIDVQTGAAGTVAAKAVKSVLALTKEAAVEDLKNIDVQMKQEGDTVRITAKPKGEQKLTNRAAAVELRVPPGAGLDLRTSNGKVTVSGGTGDAAVTSSNGRIEVKGSKGALRLKTSNGGIRVEGGSGQLDLRTSNGPIDVKAAKAKVSAHTTNGSIRFAGSLADGEHSFETSNGGVSVALPADARFHLDAQTSNGRVTCGFAHKKPEGKSKSRLQTTVGENPAVSLKLRTSNGNVAVQPEKGGGE
jgi:RNA polymerase sigma factor (sigma-70 family)